MSAQHEIYRTASELIQRHGVNAELEAARCADLMLHQGDRDGVARWLRIKRAIAEMTAQRVLRIGAPVGEPVAVEPTKPLQGAPDALATLAPPFARLRQATGRALAAVASIVASEQRIAH